MKQSGRPMKPAPVPVEVPEPEPAPDTSKHREGCSCHKESAAYCCGSDSIRVNGWHVDPACPWRPQVG